MNKFLIYVAVILLLSSNCYAQTEVKLIFRFQPEKTYTNTSKSSILTTMRFSGDAKTMAKIKAQGVKLPMVLSLSTEGVSSSVTGKVDSVSQHIPLRLSYKKLQTHQEFNGKAIDQPNPLAGKTFVGNVIDGKLHIDSIAGVKLPDSTLVVITKAMNNIFNQLQLPDRTLKVGESFTQPLPLSIPVPGLNNSLTLNLNTTYKLIQVNNGRAYFDIIQKIVYQMTIAGKKMTAGGAGSGKLIYNIGDKTMEDYHTTFDVNMRVQMDKTTTMIAAMHANSSTSMTVDK